MVDVMNYDDFKNIKPRKILEEVEAEMKDLIIPDLHIPFHDPNAVNLTVKVANKIKPDRIIQVGDFYDFYSVSKFDKDPKRIDTMQDELDVGYKVWKSIRKAVPKAEILYLEGNHEYRLRKYLWRHPELHSLDVLKLENVLRIKELKIDFYKNKDTLYLKNNLIATHGANDDGCKLSQHSGYSAKNTLERIGTNGISGHTHRLASHYKTTFDKQYEWHESGCLCDLDPEYMKKPNWQHGFVVVNYGKKGFDIKVIPIKEGYWCFVNGKEYRL